MRHEQKGFTLVELLVVISIITILAGLLLPALKNAVDSARRVACLAQQKQIYTGALLFADDHDSFLPPGTDSEMNKLYLNNYNWGSHYGGSLTGTPFTYHRDFWSDYCGVTMTHSAGKYYIPTYRGFLPWCPSTNRYRSGNEGNWQDNNPDNNRYHADYFLAGCSVTEDQTFALARVTRHLSKVSGESKVMFSSDWGNRWAKFNPHSSDGHLLNTDGRNMILGDGSGSWLEMNNDNFKIAPWHPSFPTGLLATPKDGSRVIRKRQDDSRSISSINASDPNVDEIKTWMNGTAKSNVDAGPYGYYLPK